MKLRNVRYRQWVRWLRYLDGIRLRGGKVTTPPAWSDNERWMR